MGQTIDMSDCPCCGSVEDCPPCGLPPLLPSTLTATLFNTVTCTCANGQSGTLTWDAGLQAWTGNVTYSCPGTVTVGIKIECNTGTPGYKATVTCSAGGTFAPASMVTVSCDPFYLTLGSITLGLCCGGIGTFRLEVTE